MRETEERGRKKKKLLFCFLLINNKKLKEIKRTVRKKEYICSKNLVV